GHPHRCRRRLDQVLTGPNPMVPTAEELYDECSEFSMAGIHECLQKKRDESQRKLAQAEAYVNTMLSRWDVEDQYIAQAKSHFAIDKQEFINYREAHCLFIKSLGASGIGNALEIREYACIAALNYRRIAQLREAVSQSQLK
ncbi:lysozyme inhibitor LprI family protein, partial [Komagataeibacter europaeus]|uniref:lysozyme inhibitor LprI family protein n=2 Tax=Komagataeibacter europaeus TaxID=33995 RepID=UPI00278C5E7E